MADIPDAPIAPDGWSAAGPRQFATTHWSVVSLAGQSQSSERAAALESLCRAYWPPLYAFIRRQGYPEADAQDLTQEFFARLLERNNFEAVDPRKGKFRTFLLAALRHFLHNEYDRKQALKRGGGRTIVSLDEMLAEQHRGQEPSHAFSPDRLFDVRWATQVLELALDDLHREMDEDAKTRHFAILKPFLTNDPGPGEYERAGTALGVSRQSVAVMVFRLRQRYRALVRGQVAHTVCSPLEVDAEMQYLLDVLCA